MQTDVRSGAEEALAHIAGEEREEPKDEEDEEAVDVDRWPKEKEEEERSSDERNSLFFPSRGAAATASAARERRSPGACTEVLERARSMHGART